MFWYSVRFWILVSTFPQPEFYPSLTQGCKLKVNIKTEIITKSELYIYIFLIVRFYHSFHCPCATHSYFNAYLHISSMRHQMRQRLKGFSVFEFV